MFKMKEVLKKVCMLGTSLLFSTSVFAINPNGLENPFVGVAFAEDSTVKENKSNITVSNPVATPVGTITSNGTWQTLWSKATVDLSFVPPGASSAANYTLTSQDSPPADWNWIISNHSDDQTCSVTLSREGIVTVPIIVYFEKSEMEVGGHGSAVQPVPLSQSWESTDSTIPFVAECTGPQTWELKDRSTNSVLLSVRPDTTSSNGTFSVGTYALSLINIYFRAAGPGIPTTKEEMSAFSEVGGYNGKWVTDLSEIKGKLPGKYTLYYYIDGGNNYCDVGGDPEPSYCADDDPYGDELGI